MSASFLKFAAAGFLALGLTGCASTSSDTAMINGAPVTSAAALAPNAYAPTENVLPDVQQRPYFITFRSRNALSYGHSFVVFGQRTAGGNVPTDANGVLIPGLTEVAGLHPASTSNIPYTIGHVMFVPSETGPSDGDTERAYMTGDYQINLTPAEYQDTVAYIRRLQKNSPVWHAVLYNCSHFIGNIANHIGLKTPPSILFPENYIADMKKLNDNRHTL